MRNGFPAPAESQSTPRGPLQGPHTASGAENDGERSRQRTLAVKLDLRGRDADFKRIKELAWQAMRYRNINVRARWADAVKLTVDPARSVPNSVGKHVRATEKGDLSGAVYSEAEREVQGQWSRHGKRVLAGAPLPEWKQGTALSIRGHKHKSESGVRLSVDDRGRFMAHLQLQSRDCEGGCWFEIPLADGAVKDHQAEMLKRMVEWEVPISKATIQIKPVSHKVILRLSYALPFVLPRFGNRCATLGPLTSRGQLHLRTECETRDYSGKLSVLLDRKDNWDAIRRRVMCQIGRHKGSARAKRQYLARTSWQDWLNTFLHQWSAEVIGWLAGQGIGTLTVAGFDNSDWPAYRFTQLLKYKGEDHGIVVKEEADLSDSTTSRALEQEVKARRRKAKKNADAIRELLDQK